LSNAAHPFGFDDAYGETAQSGHVFRAMTSSNAAAVFVIVPIDDVMATVFDTPVPPVGGKNAFGIGLFRGSAGNAIGGYTGVFAAFFICGFPLDDKSLSDMGKVEIGVEFCCGPDFTDFDSAVVRRIALYIIRLLAVCKEQGDVLKQSGLVVFDSEVVMSVTFDQVGGDVALGQQGIGRNVFAVDIDGIQ